MNTEQIITDYLQNFCEYFDSEIEHDSLKFYDFARNFEQKFNLVKINWNLNKSNSKKLTSIEQIFETYQHRLLLLGEPGAGKTVLLRSFAKIKGNERLGNANKSLPIFAAIRSWNGETNEPIIDWLLRETKIVCPDIELDENSLEQQIRAKKVLLMLDGLDELPANVSNSQDPNVKPQDYRVNFIQKLSEFEAEYGDNQKMIVTCRERDYEEIISEDDSKKLNLNGAVLLKQLNYKEIKNYLEHIFDRKVAFFNKLWTVLTKNLALLKMIRTPFLLTVLVLPYVNNQEDNESEAEQLIAVANPDQLFDNFLNNSYLREHKKQEEKGITVHCSLLELKQILGQVAILMMSDLRPDDNEIFLDIFERVIPEQENINEFIKFAQNLYLLIKTHHQSKEIYRFRHLLLQYYFTFTYALNYLENINYNNEISQKYQQPPTKSELAIALGKLNRLRATDLLIDLLKDQNKDVRYEAANSLGQLDAGVYFRGYKQDFSQPYLQSRSLNGFDKASIKKYFSGKNYDIEDSEVEKIAEFSLGIPFVVEQIASNWGEYSSEEILAPVSQDTQKTYRTPSEQVIAETVNRFLVHCKRNPQDKRAIYILAMMRRPDEEFLKEMLGVNDVRGKLEQLYEKYSFILPEQLELDEKYAKFLKDDLLIPEVRTKPEIRDINKQAINHFRIRLKKLTKTENLTIAEKRIGSKDFTELFSDFVHHKLWWIQEEDEALDYLIPYLIEGWYYNHIWTLSLLEIATKFSSPKNELLQIFNLGLASKASEEDKSRLLDKLEEAFNRRKKKEEWENYEWKAIVLLKSGDLYFNQKQYPEAIQKFQLAKQYLPQEESDLQKQLEGKLLASERLYQFQQIHASKENEEVVIIDSSEDIQPIETETPSNSEANQTPDKPEINSTNNPKYSPIEASNPRQNTSIFLGIIIGLLFAIVGLLSVFLWFNINRPSPSSNTTSNNEKLLYETAINDARKGDIPSALDKLCMIPNNSEYFDRSQTWIKRWLQQDAWRDTVTSFLKQKGSSCSVGVEGSQSVN